MNELSNQRIMAATPSWASAELVLRLLAERYDDAFVANCNDEELAFVVQHEMLHYMHDVNKAARTAALWNTAADYIVNETLREACVVDTVKLNPEGEPTND